MQQHSFTVRQASLVKALLYGHVVNIFIGTAVFVGLHWGLGYSTPQSVGATVFSTLVVSILVSILGTRRLAKPLAAINNEISELHQKVTTSTSALAEVNESTAALLDNMPIGFLVFDKKANLTRSNAYASKLLGLPEGTQPTADQIFVLLKTLRSGGKAVNFIDWLHEAKAGKLQDLKRWPLVTITQGEAPVVCDVLAHYNRQESHQYELVILLIDRTEEYQRQEKQMEFISLAAHELRGPITVMRGLIDILSSELPDTLSAEHKELLIRMAVSSRQLAGYVDNILNVSRIDRETFEVQPSEAVWQKIVDQASSELLIRAKANHRTLEVSIAKDLPTVAVDSTAILHVLNNLIDNAIKYSADGGKVVVSAKLKENMVETTVQDFGIGIPGNVVENLFVKFYRSHRSKQIVSGTGLGLYLCKAIVEAHGGNIWVRSTEGVGTTFGFTLPTYASVAAQLKANQSETGIIRGSHGWIKNHALYRR